MSRVRQFVAATVLLGFLGVAPWGLGLGRAASVSAATSQGSASVNELLRGVASVSPTDVWAVGHTINSSGVSETLIEHFNGSVWSVVPSPSPGTLSNDLWRVAAVCVPTCSPNDVWAVGGYLSGSSGGTLIEHFNGQSWSVVPSPSPGLMNGFLYGIAAISPTDVWAVGDYITASYVQDTLIEHFNGSSWSVVPSPDPGPYSNSLYSVAGTSATNVWAVGGYGISGGNGSTLIEHFDGHVWSVAPSPNVVNAPGNALYAVAATSPTAAVAVGSYSLSFGVANTLVEEFNGSAWSVVSSPDAASASGNFLLGVAPVCTPTCSPRNVWAVGFSPLAVGTNTLIEHFNGQTWSIVPSPNAGTGGILNDVAAIAPTDAWAVGTYGTASGQYTLIEHFNGTAWSVVPSP